ncbi:MAG: hypothetical protein K2W95_13915 [Candidatus Obscuribacterales bacterium]|nr:hypothetical protein [Candidatus Obscuribacterales bacterium]
MGNELDHVLENTRLSIAANNIDVAMEELASWLKNFRHDHRLLGRVFGSREIDNLCMEIGHNLCNALAISLPPHDIRENRYDIPGDTEPTAANIVFVASNLYLTGGHTALIEDYIKALPNQNSRILITDPDNDADREAIMSRLSKVDTDLSFSPRTASARTKLAWLINELKSGNQALTFFVHHPDDIIAVAAMQKTICRKIVFVHHTDHTFTLGLYADADVHVDFRAVGYKNCRENQGIANNRIFPLASYDYGCPKEGSRFKRNIQFVTCTSGNNKFEFPYSFQLAECIPQWLQASGGRHIHIGNLSVDTKRKINHQLQTLAISPDRVQFITRVDNLWKTLILEDVDLYIDSFPLCGCRALVEATGAGVPVTVHRSYAHELFSNQGFAYSSAFIWKTREDLTDYLKSLNSETLQSQSAAAREHFLKEHTLEVLSVRLNELITEAASGTQESLSIDIKSDHSKADSDALRSFLDCFAPFPQQTGRAEREKIERLIAVAAALELSEDDFKAFLASLTSPSVFKTYNKLHSELERSKKVLSLINAVYPVIVNEQLHNERLSRLLFAVSQLKDSVHSVRISNKSKLFARVKQFYRLLARRRK